MTEAEFLAIPEAPLFSYTETKGPDGITVRTPHFLGRAVFEGNIIDRVHHDGCCWMVFRDTDGTIRRQMIMTTWTT